MNDLQLQHLLREADEAQGVAPPISAERLLTAALTRRRTASRRRRAAAATVAALLLCMATVLKPSPDAVPNKTSLKIATTDASRTHLGHIADIDRLRNQLIQLENTARMHQRIVRAVKDAPPTPVKRTQPSQLDGPELARSEAERSAALTWQYASQVEHEFKDATAARREYQRLIDRFPSTKWADLAAVSLQRLSSAAPSSL